MNDSTAPQVPVAIIGIGCMFAKSDDLKSFWHLLSRGISGISDPPESHQYLADYFDPDPHKPDHIYCNRGGYLPSVDFDPTEFGIPPNALEATDTSQLLGLVTAKNALADAGYGPNGKSFDRTRASVIIGVTGTQELVIPLGARLGHPFWQKALQEAGVPDHQAADVIQRIGDAYVGWQENSFPGLLGNVVAGRIANRLDFGGTNCVVDAACASSMGAIHMALLELNSGRSNLVLTGGVDTINDAFMHMCFSKTRILSASGDIRPFSKDADGTVLGEGIGLMVLKRLDDAERDGDRIYAVIKGMGAASDGKSQSIYAPRPEGQARALQRAYQSADIDPAGVALVEAHGTGTRVGDQVEFKALRDVFGAVSPNGNRCALGSVKSNIGHTKAAAGSAGLIKAALSLYHKVLPPTLKADAVDPNLGIEHSPFYLSTHLRPWISNNGDKRRAGVSAFGFGGSNFHTVLEEYGTQKKEPSWDGAIEVAAFSAHNDQALVEQIAAWAAQLGKRPKRHAIGKLARQSRRQFQTSAPHRLVMVLDLTQPLEEILNICRHAQKQLNSDTRALHPSVYYGKGEKPGKLALLFPGQGSQYVGMGRDLICCFPQSLSVFQHAASFFQGDPSLNDYVHPRMDPSHPDHESQLRRTQVAQPAIGAVSVAMLNALAQFDVVPDATCGHSFGELTALHAAGWITADDLWRLAVARGKLMADAGSAQGETGTMLAVKAPLEAIENWVARWGETLVLANRNSPQQGVLSGSDSAIAAAETVCQRKGWPTVKLPVAAAFHSPLVANAQKPFAREVAAITLSPTATAVMSNTNGGRYPKDDDAVMALLAEQLAHPVDFVGNLETLYQEGIRTFVEVGPKNVLTRLVSQTLEGKPLHALALDPSCGRRSGIMDLAHALARLSALGHQVRLDRWEKPAPAGRQARMAISISGANYRKPKADHPVTQKTTHASAASTAPGVHKPLSAPVASAPIRTVPMAPSNSRNNQPSFPTEKTNMDPSAKKSLQSAMATVQQGLASLQALQAQTTQAHQKYLETQAEASKTLQQLIQSTQQLTAETLGQQPTAPGTIIEAAPAEPKRETGLEKAAMGAVTKEQPAAKPPASPAASASSKTNLQPDGEIRNTLMGIVSELTGYPQEMLGVEMDIESDLGIDSIKRVEILSALEEKMPDLPKVTPDMMGTLKTLEQICEYLSTGSSSSSAQSAPAEAESKTAANADMQAGVQQTLMGIVSELTGYPQEMLGVEMDIEADLGIDSIKRVEILSALEEKMPDLPKVTPDMMGTLKTLGQICEYLSTGSSSAVSVVQHSASDTPIPEIQAAVPDPIERRMIEIVPLADPSSAVHTWPAECIFGLVGGSEPFGTALVNAFAQAGLRAKVLTHSEEIMSTEKLCALILIAPISAHEAFNWTQAAAPLLQHAAGQGMAGLFTVSFIDGAFGFSGRTFSTPEQGALAGLAKTAALEWPAIHCRALDIDPQWAETQAVSQAVVNEVMAPDPESGIEIGLRPAQRVGLRLHTAHLNPLEPKIALHSNDVVVVTGGARGVTAVAAEALARQTQCTLALLGRSPEPQPEPQWLAGLEDAGKMKQAIMHHLFEGKNTTPKQVEAVYKQYQTHREIQTTLDRLSRMGIAVRYFSVDIRNPSATGTCLDVIRKEMGPVRGVIHGAGIVDDRLIVDKSMTQFQNVYDTKVQGLATLLEATPSDRLRYLVLFSSVSARMGNYGQVDYAMANEVLNKMAIQQAQLKPNCKVIAINWGPWDGGMVTPSLKKTFKARGVGLIPLNEGAMAMVSEMAQPRSGPVEVVIGAALHGNAKVPATTVAAGSDAVEMALTCNREIDLKYYPVLNSHQIDGRPVVPLALITEWLAHSALHANPGLTLHGIDHLRLLNGIALDSPKKMVQMMAGKAQRKGALFEVDVEIRNGVGEKRSMVHSSAKAILTESLPIPPKFQENGHFKSTHAPRSLDEIYSQVLFHGDDLRGIREIIAISEHGISARIAAAPPPAKWMHEPLRSSWLADPLVLDSAFQMAIVWCFDQMGQVCLPSYAARYRQFCRQFPSAGVSAVLEVQKATAHKLVCDFTFLDPQKEVVANLTGYEAIMAPNLIKAFKAA